MTRVLFGALAVADAVLLAVPLCSITAGSQYDLNENRSRRRPASWSSGSSVGFLIAERVFFAAYFGVIGAGIWRELTRRELSRRCAC